MSGGRTSTSVSGMPAVSLSNMVQAFRYWHFRVAPVFVGQVYEYARLYKLHFPQEDGGVLV